MNKEIEWFCFHLVDENMLAAETCHAIASAITEQGFEVTLEMFAQTIIDNDLCEDVERLQDFVEMVEQEARMGFPPPENIFAEEEPEEIPEEPLPKPKRRYLDEEEDKDDELWEEDRAPERKQEHIEERDPLVAGVGEEWLAGWPDLSQAEFLDAENAMALLNDFLHKAREAKCSDVHISTGSFPFVRRFKDVFLVSGQKIVTPKAAEMLNLSPLTAEQRKIYEKTHDLDYSYSISVNDRYRTNVMLQRLGVAGSYRLIDQKCRTLRELGFMRPDVIEKMTTHHQGLILVTGPAGCGKSTTLAALVDYINRHRHDHIICVEDPIEVIHQPQNCNITQRELNTHTRSFSNALRAALREDPDIIVIGELRDLETIEMAISSSETGHLVIGTLHTGSAPTTMDRILDVFPPNQQAQIRSMVSESLKGVICQQLLPNATRDGVALASEIMLGTLAVSNLIRDGKTYQLNSVIQTGHNIGMSTMEQSHFDLYMAGRRSYEQTIPEIQTQELIRQMQQNEARLAAEAAGVNTKKKGWGFGRK